MSDIIPSKLGTGDGYQGDNSGRRQVVRQKSTVEYTNTYGPTGPQGDGPQGFQGVPGATGLVGIDGNQANFGNQGSQGYKGLENKGYPGYPGNFGAQANRGRQGSQGYGAQGFQGSGLLGNAGFSGGIQGETGFKGFAGSQGVQGAQGISGVQGPQGWQGYQGEVGFSVASRGPINNKGPDGLFGIASGFRGQQGPQGIPIIGFQGPQGQQGPQGTLNIDGVQGPQGIGVLPLLFEDRSFFYDDYISSNLRRYDSAYGLSGRSLVEGAKNGVMKVSTFQNSDQGYHASLIYGSCSLVNDNDQIFKTSICFDSPRDDNKVVMVGFMGPFGRNDLTNSADDILHGSFFKCDPDVNAGRWTIGNYDNGSFTESPTSIKPIEIGSLLPAGLEFQHLEVRRGSSNVEFYLDSTLVGSISDNIPQNEELYFGVFLSNKAEMGTSAESVYVDYISMSRLR